MILFPGTAGGGCPGVSLCLHLQPGWFESSSSRAESYNQIKMGKKKAAR